MSLLVTVVTIRECVGQRVAIFLLGRKIPVKKCILPLKVWK